MTVASFKVEPFNAKVDWAEPDLTIIRPERPAAPKLTEEELNEVFGPWAQFLTTAAEVKGAPVDFVALSLITVASALIGNSRWANPWNGWQEPPIIWGMLIGDPSSGKSPAIDAITDLIKKIDHDLAAEYQIAYKTWVEKDDIAKIELAKWKRDVRKAINAEDELPTKPEAARAGSQPVRARIRVTDTTSEKAACLVSDNPRGLLLCRDELSGWLGSMDRYNGGGDRSFWLETFGGRSFTVDRKGAPEPIMIDHLSISILGGTQPDRLDSLLLRSDDDGLLARVLTVHPSPVPLHRPTVKLDSEKAEAAFRRLYGLEMSMDDHGKPRPVLLPLDELAQQALQDLREQCRAWEGNAAGLMKSHIGKIPGLTVRVATVLALLDWAMTDTFPVTSISVEHLRRARHYVSDHMRKHALRAYGLVSMPPEVKAAGRIGAVILAEKLRQISTREIQRRELAGLESSKEIIAAFLVLQDAGWLAPAKQSGKGRPSKMFDVNPHLEVET